jgi:hypothetical protein
MSKVGGTTFYDVDGMTLHHLLVTNIHANKIEATKQNAKKLMKFELAHTTLCTPNNPSKWAKTFHMHRFPL